MEEGQQAYEPIPETAREPSGAHAGQQDLLPHTTMPPLGNGTSTSTTNSSTASVDMHGAYNPMPMETSAAAADNCVSGEHETSPAVVDAPAAAAAAAAPGMSAEAVLLASSMTTTSLPPVAPPTTTTASNSNSTGYNRPGLPCFRKLEPRVLLKYLEHHGLTAKADATTEELAMLVSRHFEREPVDEDVVLHSFFMSGMQATNTLGKFEKKRKRGGGAGGAHYASHHYGGGSGYAPVHRKEGGRGGGGGEGGGGNGSVATVDEEVAARLSCQLVEDSTAGWILARIIKYVPERDTYQVRDEDDHANVQTLPSTNVIRLHEDNLLDVQKNDTVLAVFPDTTSFYRAQVTKVPKRAQGGMGPLEVMVKFEDDEDETGRTPHRRVPARHVLKLSQVGRFEAANGLGREGTGDGGYEGLGGGGKKGSIKDYKIMISHALQKLPNSKGTLKEIFKIIENEFRDELHWKIEGGGGDGGKKAPIWKQQVRKLLTNPRSGFMFINAGGGERGSQVYYESGGGGGGGVGGGRSSFHSS